MNTPHEEKLQANALAMGARLHAGLTDLMSRHACIGDVRGKGLMLGVELVEDRRTKAPGTAKTADVLEATKKMGLLVGKGGLHGNVLRIKPPLCITAADGTSPSRRSTGHYETGGGADGQAVGTGGSPGCTQRADPLARAPGSGRFPAGR